MTELLVKLAEQGQLPVVFKAVLATIIITIGTCTAAIVQGRVISNSVDAITKQPESAGNIRNTMIIGLAMVESMAIYCLLISLLFIFIK